METPTPSSRPHNSAWLMLGLAALPAALLLCITWQFTGVPKGDGYIQSFFTVFYYLDANTLSEKISHTWWTYFQHRGILSKIITLSMYGLLGYIDIKVMGVIANLMLCILVYLMARNMNSHRMAVYCIPIASFMILSFYPHTVIMWPECAVFYFGTMTMSFACFYLLDCNKPQVLLAIACCWMATFTMANGILSTAIGSMIVIYNQHTRKLYSNMQISLWFCGIAATLALYFATMNVFSTDLYGAKSLQESFINTPGRIVDFLESMGAAPFFPDEHRTGKIILGCIMLAAMAALATSKKSFTSPALVGLLLFSTGTLFITSLFRYSAGGNDGYQIFTSINMAVIFIIASSHITHRNPPLIPVMMVATAIIFNANALTGNIDRIKVRHEIELHKLVELSTGKPSGFDPWIEAMLLESIATGIYRPATLGIENNIRRSTADRAVINCETMTKTFSFKPAFAPIISYYCKPVIKEK